MEPSRRAGWGKAALWVIAALLTIDIGLRLAPPERARGEDAGSAAARLERRRDATVRAVMQAGPAVANISAEQLTRAKPKGIEDFFEGFLPDAGRRPRKTRSLGSGVIIHGDGFIITNAHVVAEARRIIVTLPNDEQYEASLVNLSEEDDLALLRVQADAPLPALRLGHSAEVLIGETVVALGNPFGLENSVTRGVVSARDRRIVREGEPLHGTFLQTDAAINPGNSGGPLVNLDAELVGINTAVHASGQGIGFAIPVDRVREILNELSDPEATSELWFGWRLREDGTKVWIDAVTTGGPADAANLAVGDTLERCLGIAADSVFDVHRALLKARAGQELDLDIRRDGKLYRTRLTPRLRPEVALVARRLGVVAETLRPAEAMSRAVREGVLIRDAEPAGPSAKVGVAAGDVLVKVGRIVAGGGGRFEQLYKVSSLETLAGFLESQPEGAKVRVYVVREGKELRGEVTLR